MKTVAKERTGWRDLRINDRHRMWGYDCPAVDIDLLMLEYDRGKAVALVEYKHEDASPVRLSHPSMQAIADLGDRAGLPAFVVRYADDFSWWYPTPLNEPARAVHPGGEHLTEAQWVAILYRCRSREMPSDWLQQA